MGDNDTETLRELIEKFIDKKLGGDAFEKLYSDIFDFEDIDETNSEMDYFLSIRELLGHYSSNEKDLKGYSNYYINENQLREKIAELKR